MAQTRTGTRGSPTSEAADSKGDTLGNRTLPKSDRDNATFVLTAATASALKEEKHAWGRRSELKERTAVLLQKRRIARMSEITFRTNGLVRTVICILVTLSQENCFLFRASIGARGTRLGALEIILAAT